jgi:hypothetical protein
MAQKKKKKILEGHKKVGKKFIPPVMQWPGFREVNWVNDIIPELIWIAVLQKKLGYRIANEAMAELHTMYIDVCDTKYLHSFFSSYDALSKVAKESLKKKFGESKYFDKLFEGLKDIQYYYPEHPLQFLYEGHKIDESDVSIQVIKDSLKEILERRSEGGTIAQAAVLFNSMATGKFNAPAGSIFCEFGEIDNYPKTDKSRQLASSIRAVINAFMSTENRNIDCEWGKSFWQKSFIIEPPTLKLIR